MDVKNEGAGVRPRSRKRGSRKQRTKVAKEPKAADALAKAAEPNEVAAAGVQTAAQSTREPGTGSSPLICELFRLLVLREASSAAGW